MPRKKKEDEVKESTDDVDTDTEMEEDLDEDSDEVGLDDSDEEDETSKEEIVEDPIEGEDEDELDTEVQAMTTAQQLLVQKKQGVMSQGDVYRAYYTHQKTTEPMITKYERARILSVRSQAIENGSTPLVPIDDPNEDPYSIAKREYDACKIPYFIVRKLPNQELEYWRLSDFKSLVPLTSL